MRSAWFAVLALVMLASCSPPAVQRGSAEAQAQPISLYERYEQLAGNAEFEAKLAEPARRIEEMAWMLGRWRTSVTIEGRAPQAIEDTVFGMQGDSLIVS